VIAESLFFLVLLFTFRLNLRDYTFYRLLI